MIGKAIYIRVSDRKKSDSHKTWKCADQELERQIRCFPYVELSDVPRTAEESRTNDGLISEKSKTEVYLGSMESKYTTRFTRKTACKKINRFIYILTDFGIGSLVIIIYIFWTLFSAHCLCYIHIDTTSSACVNTYVNNCLVFTERAPIYGKSLNMTEHKLYFL